MPLIYPELTSKIIGCAFRVHRKLGPGFLEKIYEQALCLELRKSAFRVEEQKSIRIFYDNTMIGMHRLDLVVEDKVVVELKACKALEDVHLAITFSYLKASRLPLGLLFNFSESSLRIKRLAAGRIFNGDLTDWSDCTEGESWEKEIH